MRYVMLVRANAESEAGVLPSAQCLATMTHYNDSMIKAGVLLAAEGLQASRHGARVRYDGERRHVVDGPFTESKELVAGFWLIQVKSHEEALEWARRVPFGQGEVELRRVFEASDFPPAARAAGAAPEPARPGMLRPEAIRH